MHTYTCICICINICIYIHSVGLTVGVDVEGVITLILRQKGRLGLRDRKVSHGALKL